MSSHRDLVGSMSGLVSVKNEIPYLSLHVARFAVEMEGV